MRKTYIDIKKLLVFGLSVILASLLLTQSVLAVLPPLPFMDDNCPNTSAFFNETGAVYSLIDGPSEGEYAPAAFVATAALNLRTGPSIDSPRILVIPNGGALTVHNYSPTGFSAVDVSGTRGYVYSQFIRPASNASAQNSAVSLPLYMGRVEMLTAEQIRQIMPAGANIQVFDINSGLTYTVRAFGIGRHVDVETITRAETDILFNSLGRHWSWDARPVIVTFTDRNGITRTSAAAIHGMPHDVSTIHDNGKNGHICIHFLGTENRNATWGAQMQAAVRQAYGAAR